MDADFTIELGKEDPVLDFPWKDRSGDFSYVNVRTYPELVSTIVEAANFPEMREFLLTVNSSRSPLETAKCDVWAAEELAPEEEIHGASLKLASYVDVVFRAGEVAPQAQQRCSFFHHESFANKLTELLRRAPDMASSTELCLRRCFFEDGSGVEEGFYFTLYVNGYGDDEAGARKNWGIGLKLVSHALLQLSLSF